MTNDDDRAAMFEEMANVHAAAFERFMEMLSSLCEHSVSTGVGETEVSDLIAALDRLDPHDKVAVGESIVVAATDAMRS